jgi:hypothetical protein
MKPGTRPRHRRDKEAALLPSRPEATGRVYRIILIRDGRYVRGRQKPRRETDPG